jgi:hypothetical protein
VTLAKENPRSVTEPSEDIPNVREVPVEETVNGALA